MKIAVETNNLVKTFKGFKAVDGLNLRVPEGAIYGFLGPNGAGKTTTLKLLTGMTEASHGEIKIFGQTVEFGKTIHRNDVGFLPDVPAYYDWMTAKEFLDFCGQLFSMKKSLRIEKVQELLTLVGLTNSANKKVGAFSRGMKQRLGIAQALINNPRIILLDEPVSALDPVGRKEVMDIIAKLAGKVTVFFSTHILADVERVCDRVVIIKEGKTVIEDTIDNIKSLSPVREILLETENNSLDALSKQVQAAEWCEKHTLDSKQLRITVNNLDAARLGLNKLIYENKLLMKKLHVLEPSLEEIYMKVVHDHD